MTALEIYDQTIKGLTVSERLQLARLIIDDISDSMPTYLETAVPRPEGGQEVDCFGGKTVGEIMTEIGFVEGGPGDLSTNPEYMRGFGETKAPRTFQS